MNSIDEKHFDCISTTSRLFSSCVDLLKTKNWRASNNRTISSLNNHIRKVT